jgi:hypothetical protein
VNSICQLSPQLKRGLVQPLFVRACESPRIFSVGMNRRGERHVTGGLKTNMTSPAASRLNDPEEAASYLLNRGAIIKLGDDGAERQLLGCLFLIGGNRLFWFAANGDDPKADGHLLVFDSAQMEKDSQLLFIRRGTVVARVTTIENSGVSEVDDFRAAWRIWQQRRPACKRLIGASLTFHLMGDRDETI